MSQNGLSKGRFNIQNLPNFEHSYQCMRSKIYCSRLMRVFSYRTQIEPSKSKIIFKLDKLTPISKNLKNFGFRTHLLKVQFDETEFCDHKNFCTTIIQFLNFWVTGIGTWLLKRNYCWFGWVGGNEGGVAEIYL